MRTRSQFRGSRTSGGAQRAFTLLELLLATAVGAVVLLAINTTFFGALRLHNTTHERIDRDLTVERSLGIIRRDLAGIMLPGGTLTGQLQSSNFSSPTTGSYGDRVTPDLFTNSGKIDGWNPFSEVQMVTYYLAPGTSTTGGKNLVRVVTRNLLPVQDTAPEETVLLEGVNAATLQFYDRNAWTDTWDSEATSTLPGGFKFSLTMEARDASQQAPAPIELIVPIVVTTTTSQTDAEAEAAPSP